MNVCTRCDHSWTPRTNSARCPKCNSPYWNVPRREKVFYDPAKDRPIKDALDRYIIDIHSGNITAAAYHLGVSYPKLAKLYKGEGHVIPDTIARQLVAPVLQPEIVPDAEILLPLPHMRNTYAPDFLEYYSDDSHKAECLSFREYIRSEFEGDVSLFCKAKNVVKRDALDAYTGRTRVSGYILSITCIKQ